MIKTVVAVAILAAAAVSVSACSGDAGTPPAPATSSAAVPRSAPAAAPTTTTTTAARPGGVENTALRAKSCRDALPLMDQLRKLGPDAANTTAEDTIRNLPATPEWPTLSAADRAATIAGIRDAAAGQCGAG